MNPHAGSSFDDVLKEDGIYEAVHLIDERIKGASAVGKTVEIRLKRDTKTHVYAD